MGDKGAGALIAAIMKGDKARRQAGKGSEGSDHAERQWGQRRSRLGGSRTRALTAAIMQRDKAAAAEKAAIMKVDKAKETRQQGEGKGRHRPERQGRRSEGSSKKGVGRRQGSTASAGSGCEERQGRDKAKNSRKQSSL